MGLFKISIDILLGKYLNISTAINHVTDTVIKVDYRFLNLPFHSILNLRYHETRWNLESITLFFFNKMYIVAGF